MDRLENLHTFVTVANEGSFTKAADKLNLSNQLVSKYVAQLEQHLKVRLFNRTTRKVHLTEAGQQCLIHAQHILESVNDLEGQLGQLQNHAQGQLKISAPVTFAIRHLSGLIKDFKAAYPDVSIDLHLNDRKIDVIEEGFDLALRIGHLQSSSLIAKHIAPIKLQLCASPEYLAKYGTPSHPQELKPEHYLRYSYMDFSQQNNALVDVLKQYARKNLSGVSCNNGEILMDAAIGGEGYVLQPSFIVYEAIKQNQLIPFLEDFIPDPVALYAVYPHRKLQATKLRAFIDFLTNYFGNPPYWDA